ncbi:MAG: hypothetical protein J6Q31_07525 [Alistipes sp.]|nr:hypothetical protein [Alistipes sp.]
MAKSLVEKVFIDGNLLVKDGVFYCKGITAFANKNTANADVIIEKDALQDGIFEVNNNERHGSPYVEYFMSGGATAYYGPGIVCFDKIHDNLLERTSEQLTEVKRLLNIEICDDLQQLLYREQYATTISILETFLYCMVLREMVFDKEKLLHNIRTFTYGEDFLRIEKHISKTDDELFLIIEDRATKIVYHNFDKVILLYKIVFRKDIQMYVDCIIQEVDKRHNIVHRNGQKLNGEVEPISKIEVENFINKVENITQNIWNLIKAE